MTSILDVLQSVLNGHEATHDGRSRLSAPGKEARRHKVFEKAQPRHPEARLPEHDSVNVAVLSEAKK
jgi:hypothetical protein